MCTAPTMTTKLSAAIAMNGTPRVSPMPSIISTMPRYIGLRPKRYGPSSTSIVGCAVGGSGVAARRKCHHAHAIHAKPASITGTPAAIERPSGAVKPNTTACRTSASAVSSRASVGGRRRSQRLGVATAGARGVRARTDESSVTPAMAASRHEVTHFLLLLGAQAVVEVTERGDQLGALGLDRAGLGVDEGLRLVAVERVASHQRLDLGTR